MAWRGVARCVASHHTISRRVTIHHTILPRVNMTCYYLKYMCVYTLQHGLTDCNTLWHIRPLPLESGTAHAIAGAHSGVGSDRGGKHDTNAGTGYLRRGNIGWGFALPGVIGTRTRPGLDPGRRDRSPKEGWMTAVQVVPLSWSLYIYIYIYIYHKLTYMHACIHTLDISSSTKAWPWGLWEAAIGQIYAARGRNESKAMLGSQDWSN